MSISLKKLWNDYGIGAILVLIIIAYVVSLFANYLSSKGAFGYESNVTMPEQYKSSGSPQNYNGSGSNVLASDPSGHNEVFSSVNGVQTSMPGLPSSCSQPNIQNPSELLPKDTNSQWAQLNHIGIDTIGQTLRNANLQIRSEPPNPQLYVGPWNQSTIEPDFMRPPLEIGSGPQ
jgi:hypothetical protein